MFEEAALIVTCPAAEDAVGAARTRWDRAAQVGVPAHLTVLYPFVPDPSDADLLRLTALVGEQPAFTLRGERLGWFGETVVLVEPVDPLPLQLLTQAVVAAFPAFPPYGGAVEVVVPHLTVGRDQPVDVLRAAGRDVVARLPFTQRVEHVELWQGPALATAPPASWRCRCRLPLAAPIGTSGQPLGT